jgi:hypothetical protein
VLGPASISLAGSSAFLLLICLTAADPDQLRHLTPTQISSPPPHRTFLSILFTLTRATFISYVYRGSWHIVCGVINTPQPAPQSSKGQSTSASVRGLTRAGPLRPENLTIGSHCFNTFQCGLINYLSFYSIYVHSGLTTGPARFVSGVRTRVRQPLLRHARSINIDSCPSTTQLPIHRFPSGSHEGH